MLMTEPGLLRWVWAGHTFTDRFVKVVEQIAPHVHDRDALEELRLVATRVTPSGLARLRRIFPKSNLTVYSDADSHCDYQLSEAAYTKKFGSR